MEELTEEQRKKMIKDVEDWAKKLAKYTGRDADFIQVNNDEYYDGMVTLGGLFSIVPYMEKAPRRIGGGYSPRYLIGHSVILPGVYRYADGSGEPDSEDFVEDETDIASAKNAVIQAFRMCLNHAFDQIVQNIEENDMAEEQKEFWGEAVRVSTARES